VTRHLIETTGHGFPVLSELRSGRARRAIATMLRVNLDPATSLVGIGTKVLAGAVYATVVGDARLLADMDTLARRTGVDAAGFASAAAFGRGDLPRSEASTVLVLTRAASSSPAAIDAEVVDACARDLSPAAIVEIVTWLSVLQLLHRLTCYIWPAGQSHPEP
jgi:hypothetical protein